jgi:hypothetical protein
MGYDPRNEDMKLDKGAAEPLGTSARLPGGKRSDPAQSIGTMLTPRSWALR